MLTPREVPDSDGLGMLYVNGFELALSNADVLITLMTAGAPQLRVNMSFTSAKTLSVALTNLVGILESVTGRTIMAMEEVGAGLEKLQNDPAGVSH